MKQNDIISNGLLKKINKIEKLEAKIKEQKDEALIAIRSEFPKSTFLEVTKQINDYAYGDEQLLVEQISEKEAKRQQLEYDDYITIFKIYNGIAPNIINKDID